MAKNRNRVAYNIQDVFFGQPEDAPFFPTDISNCLVWWDVDDERNSDFNTTKKVLPSIDGSSATLDAQGGNESRVEKAINNKPAILLDQSVSDSWLASDIGYHVGELDSEHSMFIVAEPQWPDDGSENPGDAGLLMVGDSNYYDFTDRGITQHGNWGTTYAYFGGGGNGRTYTWATNPNHKPHIYVHRYNGGTSHSGTSLKIDGLLASSSYGTPVNIANCRFLSVGRGSSYWKGYIAEVIVYDRLLDGEETRRVEKYLSEKWNVSLPASDQQTESFEILKRINRVQNFDYTFNTKRTSEGVLGKSSEVDRPIIEPPSVDINLSFYLDGVNNEHRMGFDVAHQERVEGSVGKIGEAGYKPPLLTNNFFHTGRYKDSKNVYLVTNNDNDSDIRMQRSGYPMFITGTTQIPSIIDPNANDYGVIAFQNCYVTNYTVDFSLGSLPRAEVGLTADNVTFYASGSGINVPRFNVERGLVEENGKEMLIPKHFEESEVSIANKLSVFKPGDVNLKVWREDEEDIYVSNFLKTPGPDNDDGWANNSVFFDWGGTDEQLDVGGATDGTAKVRYINRPNTFTVGQKYRISASVYIPSASTNLTDVWFLDDTWNLNKKITTKDTWVDISEEFIAGGAGFYIYTNSAVDWTPQTSSPFDVFQIKNIVVTEVNDSINFHSDTIQSCNITVNCNRENVAYLGYKHYADRPIKTPMTVDVNMQMLVKENLTGDFVRDISKDLDYNIDISCQKSGITLTNYLFSGSRFDSINYASSIGSNKTANIKFSTAMDHDNFEKGLFLSGRLLDVVNEVTLATAGSERADTDTDSIYEKGTDVGLPDDTTEHDILYGTNPLY